MCLESSFWMAAKLAINQKKDNYITISWHDAIVKSLWRYHVSLVKLSYLSKFLVISMTGSGAMTIFVYKGLTRNLEIWNTLIWVFPNIWRLGQVKGTKFGKSVSNKMLVGIAKCHGYSFYHFRVKYTWQIWKLYWWF